MQVRTNLEGEHNNVPFTLYNGYLNIFGARLTKQEIQTIVEVSSLLTAQGYHVRKKDRVIKSSPTIGGLLRGEVPQYEEEEEDFNR